MMWVWLVVAALTTSQPEGMDLDGDGRAERMTVRHAPDQYGQSWSITIRVGDAAATVTGENFTGQLIPADIDTADRFVELLVPEDGPSGDFFTTVLKYDDGELVDLGKIPGKPGFRAFEVTGLGVIKTTTRGNVLHTWFHPVEYVLRDGRLARHRQPEYDMGSHHVALKQDLPLRAGAHDATIVGTLLAGEQATLVATDDMSWVRIRSRDRHLEGVFLVEDFGRIPACGQRAHEVFDGLCMAD